MSLAHMQSALAELFTSVHARERYHRDPHAFARGFALNERERAQLHALMENGVAAYASTLVRKRRAEALRLLPNTSAHLSDDFAAAFDAWALRMPLGEGPRRYALDAVAFCRHLLRERRLPSPNARRVVLAEMTSLRRYIGSLA